MSKRTPGSRIPKSKVKKAPLKLMPKRKVMIIGSELGHDDMFIKQGWEVVTNLVDADLIQFTGGEDVSPCLYNSPKYHSTCVNPDRDNREIVVYNLCVAQGKAMAGICRGGQFLNVMLGGTLWQDVNGHQQEHEATWTDTGEVMTVSSTHHQAMIPAAGGMVLMVAGESLDKKTMKFVEEEEVLVHQIFKRNEEGHDIEAIVYKTARVFCFQPHPEYAGFDELSNMYFYYLEKYLFKGTG